MSTSNEATKAMAKFNLFDPNVANVTGPSLKALVAAAVVFFLLFFGSGNFTGTEEAAPQPAGLFMPAKTGLDLHTHTE